LKYQIIQYGLLWLGYSQASVTAGLHFVLKTPSVVVKQAVGFAHQTFAAFQQMFCMFGSCLLRVIHD
jgi:hypothetical protein